MQQDEIDVLECEQSCLALELGLSWPHAACKHFNVRQGTLQVFGGAWLLCCTLFMSV